MALKVNSSFFVKNPLLVEYKNKKEKLSSNDKALVIALTVFSAILTAGIAAPFVFFALAKCLREKRIKHLKQSDKPVNPQIPLLPPIAKPPKNFTMQKHVFQENTLEHGRLYYKGDVPILEINTDDPHKAGYVHGYLTAPALDCILKKLNRDLIVNQQPTAKNVKPVLAKIVKTLPKEYLDEMEGVVAGYNAWATERGITNHHPLDLNELLFFHMIPDKTHFRPNPNQKSNGCTFIADDRLIGRTLDWSSHDVFGTFSLAIVKNKKRVDLSVAGLVGTITGMTKDLFVSMNVCRGYTESIQGMPAVFYNRMCLETCKTVDDVSQKVFSQNPLGNYHLCVADAKQAKAFHLFQGNEGNHVVRENNPLFVTNCRYPTPDTREDEKFFISGKRQAFLTQIFQGPVADPFKRMQKTLERFPINNQITLHKVIAIPGKMLQFAFANNNAGSVPLTDLNFEELIQGE